jgi:hypothetical protein
MVDVVAFEPPNNDVIVVNIAGTRITTVPGSPGRDGTAIVEVVVFEPANSDVIVVS